VEMVDRATVLSRLNDDEKNRIRNAMHNKGLQDMRDLMEKVILENIGLKKENDMFKAKAV
jgi:hypothetical protein